MSHFLSSNPFLVNLTLLTFSSKLILPIYSSIICLYVIYLFMQFIIYLSIHIHSIHSSLSLYQPTHTYTHQQTHLGTLSAVWLSLCIWVLALTVSWTMYSFSVHTFMKKIAYLYSRCSSERYRVSWAPPLSMLKFLSNTNWMFKLKSF